MKRNDYTIKATEKEAQDGQRGHWPYQVGSAIVDLLYNKPLVVN